MSKFDKDGLWEFYGAQAAKQYADHTTEEILKELVMYRVMAAEYKKQMDHLYKLAKPEARDVSPHRNDIIADWISKGIDDAFIMEHAPSQPSEKVIKNIRLSLGIKKAKGRPKKDK